MSTDKPVDRPASFGKYELIDRLGRGGMADVWRARIAGPQGFQRTLVLKRILPHLVEDPKARQLFEREARVISRLSHANIVKVFEFGEIDGEYFLTMEYVDGRDLAAIIRVGAGSPGLGALVIRDVCRALAYAHALRDADGAALRILHRDISPSNIMVGHDGAVRLLDFGIAKAFADPRDKRTIKGTLRGKFGYIAPEVIDGEDPDGRADLFSVGVVLHETLCGKRLFRGNSDLETLSLVKRAQIPVPSTLNPAVPHALDAICMRALERDRNKRYTSGDELAEALDHVVHELRFGPQQLTEVLARYFGGGKVPDPWMPESSGPKTVSEMPVVSPGMGTANSFEEDHSRPTSKMPTDAVEKLARESMAATLSKPAKGPPRETQPETIAAKRSSSEEVVAAHRQRPPDQKSSYLFLVGGVLVGGALTGVLFLSHRRGDATKPPPPKPVVATPDLAQIADMAVAPKPPEEEHTLIFKDDPEDAPAKKDKKQ
jgi:serine/threonine-protein kinase